MALESGNWAAHSISISAGNHQLKFANTNNWSGDDWGNASGLKGTAQLTTGGRPNISFTITQTGTYDIYFNDISFAYSIGSPLSVKEDFTSRQYKLDQTIPIHLIPRRLFRIHYPPQNAYI